MPRPSEAPGPPAERRAVGMRIGEILADMGFIDPDHIEHVLEEQKRSRKRFGQISIAAGLITETHLVRALGRQLGLAVVDPTSAPVHERAKAGLPRELAARLRAVPIAMKRTAQSDVLVVATSDPLRAGLIEEIQARSGVRVELSLAIDPLIERALELLYVPAVTARPSVAPPRFSLPPVQAPSSVPIVTGTPVERTIDLEETAEEIKAIAEPAPVVAPRTSMPVSASTLAGARPSVAPMTSSGVSSALANAALSAPIRASLAPAAVSARPSLAPRPAAAALEVSWSSAIIGPPATSDLPEPEVIVDLPPPPERLMAGLVGATDPLAPGKPGTADLPASGLDPIELAEASPLAAELSASEDAPDRKVEPSQPPEPRDDRAALALPEVWNDVSFSGVAREAAKLDKEREAEPEAPSWGDYFPSATPGRAQTTEARPPEASRTTHSDPAPSVEIDVAEMDAAPSSVAVTEQVEPKSALGASWEEDPIEEVVPIEEAPPEGAPSAEAAAKLEVPALALPEAEEVRIEEDVAIDEDPAQAITRRPGQDDGGVEAARAVLTRAASGAELSAAEQLWLLRAIAAMSLESIDDARWASIVARVGAPPQSS